MPKTGHCIIVPFQNGAFSYSLKLAKVNLKHDSTAVSQINFDQSAFGSQISADIS